MMTQIFSIISLFLRSIADYKSSATKYLVYTGMLALVVFAIIGYLGWKLSSVVGIWLADLLPTSWSHESTVFTFLTGIAINLLFWILMKYIMLILMSPLLSLISEKIEKQISHEAKNAGFSFATSAARSVRINLRNLTKEIVLSVILLIAGLIPGINVISLPLLFIVQAYFAGFGIMDFYLERHYTFLETKSLIWQHKWAAVTLGSIFSLLMLVPIIGVFFSPFLTTVTGTRYFASLNQTNPIT